MNRRSKQTDAAEKVRYRLRGYFGRTVFRPHGAPVDELILTVLSQNTNDRNRDVAFSLLRKRFSTWEQVLAAPTAQIEIAIKPGGISKIKSKRIKVILKQIAEANRSRDLGSRSASIDLSWLEEITVDEARNFLCSLPGVGRKTAACVLLFSYGIADIPVDTHVFRTSTRLGLIPANSSFDRAHDELGELFADFDPYESHVNLLRLGRRICRPKPLCGVCPLKNICPYAKSKLGSRKKFWRE